MELSSYGILGQRGRQNQVNRNQIGMKSMPDKYKKRRQDATHERGETSKRPSSLANSRTHVSRLRKRDHEVAIPASSHRNPRTTLSWLIDNNVVLPRAKVRCLSEKGGVSLGEGMITRGEIKCRCCGKLFRQTAFLVHNTGWVNVQISGSYLYLDDGRSFIDCQREIMVGQKPGKHISVINRNEYICSVCHYGGDLILCDKCPSSYHKTCLGLKETPDGDWFCPPCRCGICGERKSKEEELMRCYQCARQYHVECLGDESEINPDENENWFCNQMCKKIFLSLQELVGKQTTVGAGKLTWSMLKPAERDCSTTDDDETVENYSKLSVALGVMHECFEPIIDPRTKTDLIERTIFSKVSMLPRLNFRGFNTVILENNDELISVATVRVHGERVAEVPLIGTRVQFRRLGMCRKLMNTLEKTLRDLGVERLIMPAIPNMINTWTTSFGFSRMTASERLRFLDSIFLNFQDTSVCEKLMTKAPVKKRGRLQKRARIQAPPSPGLCDESSEHTTSAPHDSSPVSPTHLDHSLPFDVKRLLKKVSGISLTVEDALDRIHAIQNYLAQFEVAGVPPASAPPTAPASVDPATSQMPDRAHS